MLQAYSLGVPRLPGRATIAAAAIVLLALAGAAPPASAQARKPSEKPAEKTGEVDTEHLFGFVTGTDIGEVGDTEAESETNGRLGKRTGSYTALTQALAIEHTPRENLRFELAALQSYHDISGVTGLDDVRRGAFAGASLEMRYRLISREQAGLGLTILAEPHWARIDDISGQPVTRYGAGLAILLDKELIPNRVIAAFNVLYQPEVTQSQLGEWSREATLGFGGALMYQVTPNLFVGAEARYLRQYDSLGLDAFAGHGVFVGPNIFFKPSERWRVTAAWSMQVAGHAADCPAPLDLANFERHQVKLRIGYHF